MQGERRLELSAACALLVALGCQTLVSVRDWLSRLDQRSKMVSSLQQVVPWGRSFDEYRRMFDLSIDDLTRTIIGCADGPAAFNAAMSRAGRAVTSVDPLYRFTGSEIRQRIDSVSDELIENARRHRERFIWDDFGTPEALGAARKGAMAEFLDDYPAGREAGRYVAAALPKLPFADHAFDLALCSHYLFTYSDQLSRDEHVAAALEMCRVAGEVRIFPLVTMFDAQRSPHVIAVMEGCRRANRRIAVRRVPYEFQRGGNEMLVIDKG